MEVDELIRLKTINRVKSEQAIRRSKALVKGTRNRLGRPMRAPEPPPAWAKDPFQRMEIVRQEARQLRETSRRAIEQSKTARGRQVALQNRSLSPQDSAKAGSS